MEQKSHESLTKQQLKKCKIPRNIETIFFDLIDMGVIIQKKKFGFAILARDGRTYTTHARQHGASGAFKSITSIYLRCKEACKEATQHSRTIHRDVCDKYTSIASSSSSSSSSSSAQGVPFSSRTPLKTQTKLRLRRKHG